MVVVVVVVLLLLPRRRAKQTEALRALPVVAVLLGLSLLCAGGARASSKATKARAVAAE
jgi:hypothetical protein